jgi:hypothetical protein
VKSMLHSLLTTGIIPPVKEFFHIRPQRNPLR